MGILQLVRKNESGIKWLRLTPHRANSSTVRANEETILAELEKQNLTPADFDKKDYEQIIAAIKKCHPEYYEQEIKNKPSDYWVSDATQNKNYDEELHNEYCKKYDTTRSKYRLEWYFCCKKSELLDLLIERRCTRFWAKENLTKLHSEIFDELARRETTLEEFFNYPEAGKYEELADDRKLLEIRRARANKDRKPTEQEKLTKEQIEEAKKARQKAEFEALYGSEEEVLANLASKQESDAEIEADVYDEVYDDIYLEDLGVDEDDTYYDSFYAHAEVDYSKVKVEACLEEEENYADVALKADEYVEQDDEPNDISLEEDRVEIEDKKAQKFLQFARDTVRKEGKLSDINPALPRLLKIKLEIKEEEGEEISEEQIKNELRNWVIRQDNAASKAKEAEAKDSKAKDALYIFLKRNWVNTALPRKFHAEEARKIFARLLGFEDYQDISNFATELKCWFNCQQEIRGDVAEEVVVKTVAEEAFEAPVVANTAVQEVPEITPQIVAEYEVAAVYGLIEIVEEVPETLEPTYSVVEDVPEAIEDTWEVAEDVSKVIEPAWAIVEEVPETVDSTWSVVEESEIAIPVWSATESNEVCPIEENKLLDTEIRPTRIDAQTISKSFPEQVPRPTAASSTEPIKPKPRAKERNLVPNDLRPLNQIKPFKRRTYPEYVSSKLRTRLETTFLRRNRRIHLKLSARSTLRFEPEEAPRPIPKIPIRSSPTLKGAQRAKNLTTKTSQDTPAKQRVKRRLPAASKVKLDIVQSIVNNCD